jgi:hypothetical protein
MKMLIVKTSGNSIIRSGNEYRRYVAGRDEEIEMLDSFPVQSIETGRQAEVNLDIYHVFLSSNMKSGWECPAGGQSQGSQAALVNNASRALE